MNWLSKSTLNIVLKPVLWWKYYFLYKNYLIWKFYFSLAYSTCIGSHWTIPSDSVIVIGHRVQCDYQTRWSVPGRLLASLNGIGHWRRRTHHTSPCSCIASDWTGAHAFIENILARGFRVFNHWWSIGEWFCPVGSHRLIGLPAVRIASNGLALGPTVWGWRKPIINIFSFL